MGSQHWEISNGRWRAKTCVAIVLRQISKAWKRGPGNTFGKRWSWSWFRSGCSAGGEPSREVDRAAPICFLVPLLSLFSLFEDGPFSSTAWSSWEGLFSCYGAYRHLQGHRGALGGGFSRTLSGGTFSRAYFGDVVLFLGSRHDTIHGSCGLLGLEKGIPLLGGCTGNAQDVKGCSTGGSDLKCRIPWREASKAQMQYTIYSSQPRCSLCDVIEPYAE